MTKRHAVLFFDSHSARFDGGQQSLLLLVTALDPQRFRPIFLGPEEGELPRRMRSAGIETIILPSAGKLARYGGAILREGLWGKSRLVVPYARYTIRLWRILKDHAVDIVHCNSIRSLLTIAPAARWRRVPLICHLRLNLDLGRWNRVAERLADRMITVSDSLRREFPGGIGDSAKFVTVPNGVDVERFKVRCDREQARAELGIPSDWKVVGMVGTLTERKGQLVLLQAAVSIVKIFPQTRFVLVGRANDARDEEYAAMLHRYTNRMALADNIIFAGWCSDTARMLGAFDLFVLPSFNEGLPRVILEAMACSLPVIATAVGGNADLVSDGRTGLLVNAQDPDALAAAVMKLLGDSPSAHAMGHAGRRLVEERFSLRAAAMGVEQIIDQLLARKNHQAPVAGTY